MAEGNDEQWVAIGEEPAAEQLLSQLPPDDDDCLADGEEDDLTADEEFWQSFVVTDDRKMRTARRPRAHQPWSN